MCDNRSAQLMKFCYFLDNTNNCFLNIIDPGFASEYEWNANIYYYFECYNDAIESADATENMVLRYTGDSDFTVDKIVYFYWLNSITWYRVTVYLFCVPENHYHWASERWTTHCTDTTSLDIFSPSSSFYIAYNITDSQSNQNLKGVVSPGKVSKWMVTAHSLSAVSDDDNDDTATLVIGLQWDRYVYKCTIQLSTTSNTYTCYEGASYATLETTNCSESAFAVEFTSNNSQVQIDSIIVMDEDDRFHKVVEPICFAGSIVVDYSTVWSDDDLEVYQIEQNALCLHDTGISQYILHVSGNIAYAHIFWLFSDSFFLHLLIFTLAEISPISMECDTNPPTFDPTHSTSQPTTHPTVHPTLQPSLFPTVDPTLDPTGAPSTSPTSHPITYEDFVYEVVAEFKIDGLSFTELTSIVRNLGMFTSNLTSMIHSGMDADVILEYNDIVLEIATINGYDANELIKDEDNSAETKLESSFSDGMLFEYLVKCDQRYHCTLYIVDEELYNRTILEVFVTAGLVSYFANTDSNSGDSSVVFTVESLTLNEGSNDAVSSDTASERSTLMMIVAALLIISICAFTIIILCFLKRKKTSDKETNNPHFSVGSISSPQYPQSATDTLPSPGSVDSAQPEVELTEQYETEGVQVTGASPNMSGRSDGEIQSGNNGIDTNLTPYHHDNAHSQDESLYDDSDASSNGSAEASAAPAASENVVMPAGLATPGSGTLK